MVVCSDEPTNIYNHSPFLKHLLCPVLQSVSTLQNAYVLAININLNVCVCMYVYVYACMRVHACVSMCMCVF